MESIVAPVFLNLTTKPDSLRSSFEVFALLDEVLLLEDDALLLEDETTLLEEDETTLVELALLLVSADLLLTVLLLPEQLAIKRSAVKPNNLVHIFFIIKYHQHIVLHFKKC